MSWGDYLRYELFKCSDIKEAAIIGITQKDIFAGTSLFYSEEFKSKIEAILEAFNVQVKKSMQ